MTAQTQAVNLQLSIQAANNGTMIEDITTPYELSVIVDLLPEELANYIRPIIHKVEEIKLAINSNLTVNYGGMIVDYPVRVTVKHLTSIENHLARYTSSGRVGIDRTLHRISAGKNSKEVPTKMSIRVARVILNVAECMRDFIENARGIALVGPPAVGKTTLLRDIARIRLERLGRTLCVVDSIGELCGFGDEPHTLLDRAYIFQVGEPHRQRQQLEEAARNHSARELLTDEVQPQDIKLLIEAKNNGTSIVCSLHGESIRNIAMHEDRRILFGLVENPRDGTVSKRDDSVFSTIIEVHARGLYRIIDDLPAALEAIRNNTPLPYHYLGDWTPEFKEERLHV